MTVAQAIILGIIQGATEFLPVSSSGHLVVFPSLLGWTVQPLVFDTFMHMGTALALVVYFWKDLWAIAKDFVTKKDTPNSKLGKFMLIGSLPAGVIGFIFEDVIESTFRGINWVIAFLLLGTILLYIAERWFKHYSADLTNRRSLLIGLFQSLALLPGVSRSGASISAGMYFGLGREEAARFSFLLAIPIVVVAGVYKALVSFNQLNDVSLGYVLIGFFTSFAVGVLAIKFLLNFVKTHSLKVFIIYRLILVWYLLLYITVLVV